MAFDPYNAAAGGMAGAGMGGMFVDYTNPADAGMEYLDKIPGTITPYFDPYIQAGTQSLSQLGPQLQRLISDPSGFLNQMGAGYKQSPGYQFSVDEATRSANQAAAAGGMLGSPAEQQALAGRVSGLASKDYDKWMNNVLGLYQTGIGGYGRGAQMGLGASTNLAQDLAEALMSQSQMAYQGQAAENQRSASKGAGMGAALGGITAGFLL